MVEQLKKSPPGGSVRKQRGCAQALVGVLVLMATSTYPVYADTQSIDFEPPAYVTGSVDHQSAANIAPNTWGGQFPPGIAINTAIDQAVSSGGAHAGSQSFRMSSSYTNGSFGDWVFSPSLVDPAGEPGSIGDVFVSGGPLQPRFTATLYFKSVTGAAQNSHVTVAPDRGDGARMSWVQVSDHVANPQICIGGSNWGSACTVPSDCPAACVGGSNSGNACTVPSDCPGGACSTPGTCTPDGRQGLSVTFEDYRAPADLNDCDGGPSQSDSQGKCFVFGVVATNLDRSLWHRIDIEMDFYAGQANDVVRVSVDGGAAFRGTSWEDYFRNNQNPPFTSPPPVDSILFQARGTAEGNAGEGFYFDDLSYTSNGGTCAAATRYVAATGDDTFNDCRDSGAPCATIQQAINFACAGDTVLVSPGTYNESPQVNKALTLQSTGGRDVTFIALQTGPTYLGSLDVSGSDVTIDGFTIIGRDGTPSQIAASNIYVDAPTVGSINGVVIKNNRLRVGKVDPATDNGDDGMGLITTYVDTGVNISSLMMSDNLIVPLNSEGTRAFFVNPGVDAFTFQGNDVTGKFDGRALTQAKNGLVQDNVIDGQGLGGRGLGTWGYPDANVWGHTDFKLNNFTGLDTALSIFETNSVTIECNRFSTNVTGVGIFDGFGTANFNPTSIDIHTDSFLSDSGSGVSNSATTAGTVPAKNNYWGCPTGPGTAGCDIVTGNVQAVPFASTAPACVYCTNNSDCSDGLTCDGLETCNLSNNMCQSGSPVDCSSLNDSCNVGTCNEPSGGCTATPKPDGTACTVGGGTCQAGTCTGGGNTLILATVRLRRNTAPVAKPKLNNGSAAVLAVVNDEDTNGALVGNLVHGTVTLEVQDTSGSFHTTIALTNCVAKGRTVRCNDHSHKTSAIFSKLPYYKASFGLLYKMTVSRRGMGSADGVGGVQPTGPVHVTLHQTGVDRPDDISNCQSFPPNRLVCQN